MAAGPKAKVTPRTQLTNGQVVKVTGKGFAAGETLVIAECNSDVMILAESACSVNNERKVTTTRKGLVPATLLTLHTGAIGEGGSCGTRKADRKCYIGIASSDLSQFALVEVFFAVP
jgi:hypothetical protein